METLDFVIGRLALIGIGKSRSRAQKDGILRGWFSAIDSVRCQASLLRCNNICRCRHHGMPMSLTCSPCFQPLLSLLQFLFRLARYCSLLLSLSSLSIVVHVPNEYRLSNTRECMCQIKSVIFTFHPSWHG